MTDALGHTTAYTYDAAGNLLSVTTGYGTSNGNFTYTYDNARNRVSMTDGNGNTTLYHTTRESAFVTRPATPTSTDRRPTPTTALAI